MKPLDPVHGMAYATESPWQPGKLSGLENFNSKLIPV